MGFLAVSRSCTATSMAWWNTPWRLRYVSAKSQKALMKKLHQSIEAYRDVNLSEDSRMP